MTLPILLMYLAIALAAALAVLAGAVIVAVDRAERGK